MIGAGALTLGLHLMSYHAPERSGLSGNNPGLYVSSPDGYTIGGFRNSVGMSTIYLGRRVDMRLGSIFIGGMRYEHPGFIKSLIRPMVVVSGKLTDNLRVSLLPPMKTSPAVIHLSAEVQW